MTIDRMNSTPMDLLLKVEAIETEPLKSGEQNAQIEGGKLEPAAPRVNRKPMQLHRLAWAAGIIGLPFSHYWLAAQVEPFYSSIYCFLWWSYIFAADFAVYKLRGTSLLRDRPKEFLFLMFWSVPVWM